MRPVHRRLWWTVALFLVVGGTVGAVIAARLPARGPSLGSPSGVTTPSSTSRTTSPPAGGVPTTHATGATPPVTSTLASSSGTPTKHRPTRHFAARSLPVHLTIPTLGISAPLSELGLNKDGTVSVPTDFAVPGWYKYGPTPGQRGSAVILGHVDSYKGPAVFFYLSRLHPGDPITVNLADHAVVHFKVIGIREYSKSNFPDKIVYGMRPYSALQLVTCGGVFDRATGHYESNIVVYTTMTSFTRPHR